MALANAKLQEHISVYSYICTNLSGQTASFADSLHALLGSETLVGLLLHKYIYGMFLSDVMSFKHPMPAASFCAMLANPLC